MHNIIAYESTEKPILAVAKKYGATIGPAMNLLRLADRDIPGTGNAKAGILSNETVWANAAKMPPEA